jgi:CubicO group peptidase (beta-lactamase class C family)
MAARNGTHNALVVLIPLALLCFCRGSGGGGGGGASDVTSDVVGLRARVLRAVEELRTCRDVAALTISVVSANGTLLAEGSGLAVVETHTPATANTRVCVASLTKAFTATLLGQLLHKHK